MEKNTACWPSFTLDILFLPFCPFVKGKIKCLKLKEGQHIRKVFIFFDVIDWGENTGSTSLALIVHGDEVGRI